MQYQLDNLDRRILDALQRDGRLQNLELARLVGLSPSACLRRCGCWRRAVTSTATWRC